MKLNLQAIQKFLPGILPYFLILATVFIVFGQSLNFDFLDLDDSLFILKREAFISNLSNIPKTFQENAYGDSMPNSHYYRPIITISFILNSVFTGVDPWTYHLVNLFLYTAAVILFYILLLKFNYSKPLALTASVFYAIHPACTQSVAWVTGRTDSLVAIFLFSFLLSGISYLQHPRWHNWLINICCFFLAIFSKETGLFFPIILGMWLVLVKKERLDQLKNLWLGSGYFAIGLLWFILRSKVKIQAIALNELILSFFVNFPAILYYPGKLLFPVKLSALPALADYSLFYGFAAIGLIALLLAYSWNKRREYIYFGIAYYLILVLPTFLSETGFFMPSEYRMIWLMPGLIILLLETDLIKGMNFKKELTRTLLGLILAGIAVLSFQYAKTFETDRTLYANAVKNSPSSHYANMYAGWFAFQQNDFNTAQPLYEKAIKINPYLMNIQEQLAFIYFNKKEYDLAEKEILDILRKNPNFTNGYYRLGEIYYNQKKYAQAKKMFLKDIEINHQPDAMEFVNRIQKESGI